MEKMEKVMLTKDELERLTNEKEMVEELLNNVKGINENLKILNENFAKQNIMNQNFIQIIQKAFDEHEKEKESKGKKASDFIPVEDITGIPTDYIRTDRVSDIKLNECAKVLPEGSTKKRVDWKVVYENLGAIELCEDGQLIFAGKGYIVLEASVENGKGDGEDFIKLFQIKVE